jgi:hypothetical protein
VVQAARNLEHLRPEQFTKVIDTLSALTGTVSRSPRHGSARKSPATR